MSERVDSIRYDEERGELVVQLTGGGAAQIIKPGLDAKEAIRRLNYLSTLLTIGIEERATRQEGV